VDPWYDTHVHLDRFPATAREGLLERARAAGVLVVAVATDLESSAAVVELAAGSPLVAGGAVGVHPRQARGAVRELTDLAANPGVVAIGECGFDGSGPGWELQAETFLAQASIARNLGLALVLHIDGDGAWDQLATRGDALEGLRVVRHYFTGDSVQAAWHAERGHFASFGNPLRRTSQLQEITARYPPELLLIETDSYPAPGRITQPADVVKVAEALAGVRGWSVPETRERLANNTRIAFGLPG